MKHYLLTLQRAVISISILITGISLTACGGGGGNGNSGTTPTQVTTTSFTIPLSSLEVVPVVNSSASANAQLTYDSQTNYLNGTLTIAGTQSKISNVHLHDGSAGVTGGVIITLQADAVNSNQYSIPTDSTLTETQATNLLSGNTYLQVHTATNANGELRGQVLLSNSNITRVQIPLSGLEVVNISGTPEMNTPINSTGSGEAVLLINNNGALYGGVRVQSLLGEAGNAHIHDGIAGAEGGVVLTFDQNAADKNLYSVPANSNLLPSDLSKLLTNKTYVQVHSVVVPLGELRGQVISQESLMTRYRVSMDGSQVVSSVTTTARGQAVLLVDNTNGNVFGGMTATGLQGAAAMGHIHDGVQGVNGGVVITFEHDSTDTNLYSIPVGANLSPAALTKLNEDNNYVQIHSDTFPLGELRGQITK